MDPDAFIFKWDPRGTAGEQHPGRLIDAVAAAAAAAAAPQPPPLPPPQPPAAAVIGDVYGRPRELGEMFDGYGVRYMTVAKLAELGFTASTLVGMRDEELDEMMSTMSQIFRWELLVGERYGIKTAVRSERRRLAAEARRRHHHLFLPNDPLDALSQEGLSEEGVQQEPEAAASGGGGGVGGGPTWEAVGGQNNKKQKQQQRRRRKKGLEDEDDDDDDNEDTEDGGAAVERQREHPFIVTEPGEVARGKKNGLDYLFHLYDQCREFLIQVQNIAKDRGEKCPTKVTNQVFRFAQRAGAGYINKPKMRHYVHCYALHCLDEAASDELRRRYKERGENVGAWRQACYAPLVAMSARHGYDIDALFNAHPRLSIWYVPTRLRQLCHAQRNCSSSGGGGGPNAGQPNY
ncbi:Floricaula protein [Acorus calamus]|uniref:Floricaula/leafy-like transcription factor n=1 Tax=Acorus calamus TaxID=4465 RepID=A0AAV9CJW0_ACOCL|nr:Floricaula protein [Acorus calamus]